MIGCSSLFISVALAASGGHFYTWYGQRVPVVPSARALVVEVSSGTSGGELAAEVGVPLSAEARPGGRSVLTLDVSGLNASARDAVRKQIAARADFVGWLMPLRSAAQQIDEIVDRRVLARFTAETGQADVERLADKLGFTIERVFARPRNSYRLEVSSAMAALALANTLVADELVLWAEPDRWARPQLAAPAVNDDYFAEQWHLLGPASHGINAADAWDTTTGDGGVVIAVIDTGVELAHAEFAGGMLVHPYDAYDDDNDPSPGAGLVDSHGTAVAGIVGAPLNAGGAARGGVVGVCPDCAVMPIRLGPGDGLWPLSVVAAAFNHATTNGALVINNSWGFAGFHLPQLVYEAMQAAIDAGTTVLFASGNDPVEMFPNDLVGHPEVIAVGGVSYLGEHISYSSFGPALDLVAPTMEIDASSFLGCPDGPGIPTADGSGDGGFNPQMDDLFTSTGMFGCGATCVVGTDYTCYFSGTSAACPVAAGAAGLLLSHRGDLTPAQVRWVMTATAEKVGGIVYVDGWNQEMGFGRPDLVAALAQIDDVTMCEPVAEDCGDAVDNDCDGLVDGADLNCGAVFPPPLDFSTWGAECTPAETASGRPGVDIASCGPDLPCAPIGGGMQPSSTGACVHLCVDECPAGFSCASYTVTDPIFGESTTSYCLQQCTDHEDCPTGWLCGTTAGLTETVCLQGCTAAAACLQGMQCDFTFQACSADSLTSLPAQDGGPQDDGPPAGDASVAAGDPAPRPKTDGGCSCRAHGRSNAALLLLLALVVLRRRR